jgi:hypothetical protein
VNSACWCISWPDLASVAALRGWSLAGIKDWLYFCVAASDVQLWGCCASTMHVWATIRDLLTPYQANILGMRNRAVDEENTSSLRIGDSFNSDNSHSRRCRISVAVLMFTGMGMALFVHKCNKIAREPPRSGHITVPVKTVTVVES